LTLTAYLRAGTAALVLALGSFSAMAGSMPEATGEVILTIDGALGADAPAGGYELDLVGLQSFAPEEFSTSTIWTEGSLKFTGVPLRELLTAAGAVGTSVTAEALNGYAVDIPIADLDDKAPIIAYFINDETFSRRDKGPLWIVYPYDRDEKYKSEISFAFSIWQLQRLTVK
jgi:hypothetical protein